jgi:cytochrome c biogenesis protein CcdA
MKRLLFLLVFLFAVAGVMAVPETNISYFYSTACTHCAAVAESGILNNVSQMENVVLEKYEVTISQASRDKYAYFADGFGIDPKERGIPFLVIEQGGKFAYLAGDGPIIEHLNDSIVNFRGGNLYPEIEKPFMGKLTLGVIIVAALIDSINPCAFGVLLFLMAVLLSMGSSKRALRAGILYTLVIFVVYLLAGLGIMKLISSFSILNSVKIIAGVIVLVGGVIEFKDFFWEGKGFSLRIPVSAKPMLEKYIRRGTLPAIFVLGALVALVELPCTGGIYLAILSLISSEGTKGLMYLVLYNFLFVLPLVLITYVIYRGAKVDSINLWVQRNKRFMRLAAGIIMILLGLSLLGVL